MRIALIGYEANISHRVGSNQYAFELLKALYNIDRVNDYTIYLPSLPLKDLPQEREGWSYKVVGPKKCWNLLGLPLALFKQRPKPDIVFSPGHYSPLFSPSPLFVSIMDLGYLKFPDHFTKKTYWKLRLGTAFSIKRAKHIFTISRSSQNDIIKYYNIDPRKITVSYPGIDHQSFNLKAKEKTDKVREKYKIEGDYLLFLSTLKPSKNIEGLLKAFAEVVKSNRKISLVIAGKKGWLYDQIFNKVKSLGIEKRVVFTGFVDENDVPGLMAGAKVFVLPSFYEGFGIPVVEAMACGTPVVVSRAGSLPEIVGRARVIVNPNSHLDVARGIKEALTEGDNLIEKGLRQAKKFNWQDTAEKILKTLEKEAK